MLGQWKSGLDGLSGNYMFQSWNMYILAGFKCCRFENFLLVQDICCLDADGALFDAALLSAVAAFSNCKLFIVPSFLVFFCFFLLL